jgi:hypothetical protein
VTLIVEDGSNVPNANTIISVSDVRSYASLRGYNLSSTDSVLEGYIIRFMDWLYSLEGRLNGYRTYEGQSVLFPRSNMFLYGFALDDDTIPVNAKNAGCEYVLLLENGIDPMLTSDKTVEGVIREKTPDFERQYSDKSKSMGNVSYALPTVMTQLRPLLKQTYTYR